MAKIFNMDLLKISFVCFAFLAAVLPLRICAIAQSVEPININDALRGEEYERKLSLFNSDEKEGEFELNAEGDIRDFTKFYLASDPTVPITKLKIAGKTSAEAIAVFTISDELRSDKVYKGYINFSYAAETVINGEEMQNSVMSGVGRPVSISIGGKEIIDAECDIIPVRSLVHFQEQLPINVECTNRGNVSLKPSVQVLVSMNGAAVEGGSMAFLYEPGKKGIKPAQSGKLSYVLQTMSFDPGDYQVAVSVFQGDNKFIDRIYDVKISDKKAAAAAGLALAGGNESMLIWYAGALGLFLVAALTLAKRLKFKRENIDRSNQDKE